MTIAGLENILITINFNMIKKKLAPNAGNLEGTLGV